MPLLALSCSAVDAGVHGAGAGGEGGEGGIGADGASIDAHRSDVNSTPPTDVWSDRSVGSGDTSATGGAGGATGRGGAGGVGGSGGPSTGGAGATGGAGSGAGGGSGSAGTGSAGSGSAGAGSAGKGGTGGTGGSAGASGSAGRDGGGTISDGAVDMGGSKDTGPVGDGGIFGQCRFHFGTLDSKVRGNAALTPQIDFFTPGWVGQSDTFDMDYACTAAKGELSGAVLAVVSYIIAFSARRDQGLQDCNVSGQTNLCRYGATYLRARLENRIIPQYAMYARGFAASCGTTRPIIWMMEPDYYQYHAGGDANALTPQEAGQIMGRLVATVRQHLPNAIFSLDISPWIPNDGADWYANFNMADFTFINTSGGGTDADNTRIRAANTMTWAGVHRVTGKPILADTGYGAAGAPTGHDAQWDVVANVNARIADGVIGVSQYNPASTWSSTLVPIRPQLGKVACF
ncbi:MAG TPA: hypothetical protein VK540_02355 [Polyangiaceae bacterium]|nr:hypothetical protein [Polyangiaceae bacterium]